MSKLSPTQEDALQKATTHGKLVRRPGGYWTFESAVKQPAYDGEPEYLQNWEWCVGTRTIQALLDSGKLIEPRRGEVRLPFKP